MPHHPKLLALALVTVGVGCSPPSTGPITIPTGTLSFSSVSTILSHSCAVGPSGAGYCWGINSSGVLGDGTAIDRSLPTPVSGGLTFTTIATGRSTSCGLITDGSAYCWGLNDAGQFGDGTTTSRSVPTVAATGHHFSWLGFSDGAAAPPYEVCGLEMSGAAVCWGRGNNSPTPVATGLSFLSISAGIGGTFCGIVTVGDAYCWGFNDRGQLGTDTTSTDFATTPTLVKGSLAFTSISAGYSHVCGIATDGQLYCWGSNTFGQLGNGSVGTFARVPVLVQGTRKYTSVVAGFDGTCAVAVSGDGYCWGYESYGNLGAGALQTAVNPIPTLVSGNLHFASISKGLFNSCGLTTAHVAYCWGKGGAGLGIGNDGDRLGFTNVPMKVGLQP